MTDLNTAYSIISIFNFCFIIFGTIGNLFTFMILMRRKLRKTYTYTRYLSALCIIDLLCLYNWNFTFVYQDLLSSNRQRIEFIAPLACRIFSFFAYSTLQASSWIMCAIGMDRILLLITSISKKSINNNSFDCLALFKKIKNPFKNTTLIIALIIVCTFCVNSVVLINNALPFNGEPYNDTNNTNITRPPPSRTYTCYEPADFFLIWDVYHVLMYSIIPFIFIFLENFAISYLTITHSRRMKSYNKQREQQKQVVLTAREPEEEIDDIGDDGVHVEDGQGTLSYHVTATATVNNTITNTNKATMKTQSTYNTRRRKSQVSKGSYVANLLIFLTISFFFTTLPYSIIYAVNLNDIFNKSNIGRIFKRILLSLQYIRHATNFLIYVLTSTIIMDEIKSLYTYWFRNRNTRNIMQANSRH